MRNLFHTIMGKSGGSSYLPMTQAFFDNAITVDTVKLDALNTFEATGTSQGWLSKMLVFHPYVGGSDSTRSSKNFINLSLYNATFYGGLTFNNNGVQGNGINGYYTTGLYDADFSGNGFFMGCYVHTQVSDAIPNVDFGTYNTMLFSKYLGQVYSSAKTSLVWLNSTPSNFIGAFTLYKKDNATHSFRKSSESPVSATAYNPSGNNLLHVFRIATPEHYSGRTLGCFYGGSGAITDTESLQINQAIELLMATLHP